MGEKKEKKKEKKDKEKKKEEKATVRSAPDGSDNNTYMRSPFSFTSVSIELFSTYICNKDIWNRQYSAKKLFFASLKME